MHKIRRLLRRPAGRPERSRSHTFEPPCGFVEGFLALAEGEAYEMLAELRVTIEARSGNGSDADLEALMKTWREGKPYDPRKGMG